MPGATRIGRAEYDAEYFWAGFISIVVIDTRLMNRSQKSSWVAISTPSPSKTNLVGIRQTQVEVENAIRRRAYELYEERGLNLAMVC